MHSHSWFEIDCWFWIRTRVRYTGSSIHAWNRHSLVSCTRNSVRITTLFMPCWYLVHWLHFRRNGHTKTTFSRWFWNWSALPNVQVQIKYNGRHRMLGYSNSTISFEIFSFTEFWKHQLKTFGQVLHHCPIIKKHSRAGHRNNSVNRLKWSITLDTIYWIWCWPTIRFIEFPPKKFSNINILMVSIKNWFPLCECLLSLKFSLFLNSFSYIILTIILALAE